MVKLTQPEEEQQVDDQTSAKLKMTDTPATNPWDRETKEEKTVVVAISRWDKIYGTKVKPAVEVTRELLRRVKANISLEEAFAKIEISINVSREIWASLPFSYDMIQQKSTQLNLIHGLSLMLCGGSWLSLATFLSFCEVYHVYDVVGELKPQVKWPEMESLSKLLYQLWMLTLIGYLTSTVPMVGKLTVALMLGNLIRDSVNSEIMAHIEERLPRETKILGRWWPLAFNGVVLFALLILSVFTYNIQACLVMASIGYRKVYCSVTPTMREYIGSIKGPFKLHGVAITLWATATFCTAWQLVYWYESSFLGIIVPIGFLLIRERNVEVFFKSRMTVNRPHSN